MMENRLRPRAETLVPLGIAIFGGNKFFCNYLCGRGQLFSKLGGDLNAQEINQSRDG